MTLHFDVVLLLVDQTTGDVHAEIGYAGTYVLDIGGSKSMKEIVQQTFNIPLPESQGMSSKHGSQFPVRTLQVFGSVSSSNDIKWYPSLTEPMLEISLCSPFLDGIHSPLLLVISSDFLRNVDRRPELLDETLHSLPMQQSQIHVVISDETDNDGDETQSEQYHIDILSIALRRKLGNYPYKLWYWKSSKHQFSRKSSCDLNIAIALKMAAIEHVRSIPGTQQLISLERTILSYRHEGTLVLSLEQLMGKLRGQADDMSTVLRAIQHLENKGLILPRRSLKGTPSTSGRRGKSSSSVGWIDHLPRFFILNPVWFYAKASSFIQAVVDQQTEKEATLLPSARLRGFHTGQILHLAEKILSGSPQTVKDGFVEACQYHGIIIDISTFPSEHSDSSVFVTPGGASSPDTPNYRNFLFIPATLQLEVLPPLTGQVVSPIAFRSPGVHRKCFPIALFYDVISALAKRFPLAVKCTRHEARFNVDPNHVLQLIYSEEYACVKATMFVSTEDPTFAASSTATVCLTVKKFVDSYITNLCQLYETVNLQFAAVIEADVEGQRSVDFVDLGDVDVKDVDQLYSVGNHPFHPPNDFYLWFGRQGKVCHSFNLLLCDVLHMSSMYRIQGLESHLGIFWSKWRRSLLMLLKQQRRCLRYVSSIRLN